MCSEASGHAALGRHAAMGGKKKMNPFAGSRPASSNTKAPRLPKAPKKRGSGGDGDGGPRKKKERSVWGLVGAVASFAALFGWTLLSRGKAAQRQRLADRRILNSMLAKPLHYTEHASCRMDCRCGERGRGGGGSCGGGGGRSSSDQKVPTPPSLRRSSLCHRLPSAQVHRQGGGGGGAAQRGDQPAEEPAGAAALPKVYGRRGAGGEARAGGVWRLPRRDHRHHCDRPGHRLALRPLLGRPAARLPPPSAAPPVLMRERERGASHAARVSSCFQFLFPTPPTK